MPVEVILPKVDIDVTDGTLAVWHEAEGAVVAKGAALSDIATDKAAMEGEAPAPPLPPAAPRAPLALRWPGCPAPAPRAASSAPTPPCAPILPCAPTPPCARPCPARRAGRDGGGTVSGRGAGL